MKLYFNQAGILTNTEIEPIRKGDTFHVLTAQFLGKQNYNYVARFSLTRPDESKINNVLMVNSSVENEFEKALNDDFYFAISGDATLTVVLLDSLGRTIASGQTVLHIESTDHDADTTITYDEYTDILTRLNQLLKNENTFLVVESLPTETELLAENQHFYNRADNKFYTFKNGSFAEVLAGQHKLTYYASNPSQLAEIEQKAEVGSFVIYYTNNRMITGVIDSTHHFEGNNSLCAAYDSVGDAFSSDKYAKRDSEGRLVVADPVQDFQAATKGYVDSQIARYGSHKLTKNAEGDNFDTFEELESTTVFYYKGIEHEPDINDFVIVNNYENKPAKFSYDGADWTFDFFMTELTEEQQEALNSTVSKDWKDDVDNSLATLETEVADKSSVSVSTSEVVGRPTVKSINVNGFDYNLGGSGGGEYAAGTGIDIEGNTISIDNTIATKTELQSVREVAEGKCKTYVIASSISLELSQWYSYTKQEGGSFSTREELEQYVGDKACANGLFNSSDDKVTISKSTYLILPNRKIIINYNDFGFPLGKGIGDVFLITETEIPDRWVSQVSPYTITFNKLETSKIDLTNVAKTDSANTFTQDQTFNGKVYVGNGEVNNGNGNFIAIKPKNNTTTEYVLADSNFNNANRNVSLGYADRPWKDLYLSGTIYLGGNNTFALSSTDYVLYLKSNNINKFTFEWGSFYPSSGNNEATLGTTTRKWKNVYIAGNLNDTPVADLDIRLKPSTSIETSYIGEILSKEPKVFSNPITSLSINNFATSTGDTYPSWHITFVAGANFSLTFTPNVKWAYGTPTFDEGSEYTLVFEQAIGGGYKGYVING